MLLRCDGLLRCIVFLGRCGFYVLPVLTDDYRADGFAAGFFVPDHGRRKAAGVFVPDHGRGNVMPFRKDDHLVRLVVMMPRRRRPPGMNSRTRFGPRPEPFVVPEEPAFIVRDVFVFVKDVAVLRDADFFRSGHYDRAGRSRDDFRRACDDDRFFHDHRLFDDCGRRFHDDRGRTRLDDRAHQVHDVGRKLDAVGRTRFVMIPRKGSRRGEDDRRGKSGADRECLVDGLLDSVSFWKRG